MKRPNITPGKWKTRNSGGKTVVCREDSQAVGIPLDVCRVWQSSFTEANARAIAALPELLAAMEGVIPFADVDLEPDEKTVEVPIESLKEIKAALTKAGYTFD